MNSILEDWCIVLEDASLQDLKLGYYEILKYHKGYFPNPAQFREYAGINFSARITLAEQPRQEIIFDAEAIKRFEKEKMVLIHEEALETEARYKRNREWRAGVDELSKRRSEKEQEKIKADGMKAIGELLNPSKFKVKGITARLP